MSRKFFFWIRGGFGGGYYIGVYKGMVERWGYKELQKKKYYGVSAGSIMALYILLGLTWEQLDNEFISISHSSKKNGIFLKASYYHNKSLEKFLYKDAYKKISGKLFIGVTNFYGNLSVISKWKSDKDLIDTIHASMHIPYYCGSFTNRLNNKRCVDGGYSLNNYKFLEENTLKIGVWNKNIYDVKLVPSLKFKHSYKSNLDYYKIIKKKGYVDILNWSGEYIENNSYRSKKKYLKLSVIWLLRVSEDIVYKII
jgi:hypothetical protein